MFQRLHEEGLCKKVRSPTAPHFHLGDGQDGAVAEWLRSGLQSRVHRFDSGPRLHPLLVKNA